MSVHRGGGNTWSQVPSEGGGGYLGSQVPCRRVFSEEGGYPWEVGYARGQVSQGKEGVGLPEGGSRYPRGGCQGVCITG